MSPQSSFEHTLNTLSHSSRQTKHRLRLHSGHVTLTELMSASSSSRSKFSLKMKVSQVGHYLPPFYRFSKNSILSFISSCSNFVRQRISQISSISISSLQKLTSSFTKLGHLIMCLCFLTIS